MHNAVLLNLVPALGNLLASLMLISPVPAVLKLRATGKLGDLNVLPLPLTAYNSMGWLAYGILTSNPYLFPSNFIGFVGGIFFTLTAHSAAPRQIQDRIMGIMLLGCVHFITMSIISLFALSQTTAERMWGTNAIIILMVYYIIPLSTMYDIIKKKNANSIYPPLACAAIANGGLWTVYGFAMQDVNLWLPNLLGAIIGIVQLVLRYVYGAVPDKSVRGVSAPGTEIGPKTPLKAPEAADDYQSAVRPAASSSRRGSTITLLNNYHHPSPEDVEMGPAVPISLSADASSSPRKQ